MTPTRSTHVLVGALAVGALSLGALAVSTAPDPTSAAAPVAEPALGAEAAPSAQPAAGTGPAGATGAEPQFPALPGVEMGLLVAGLATTEGDAAATAVLGRVEYHWPTGGPVEVLRAYDPPEVPWGPGHRGVDLALGLGEPVLAAADGTVAFAGTVVDRPVVSVLHDDGLRTTYEPVEAVALTGQRVRAGDVLGHLRGGHCPPWQGACLHWGARSGASSYVDPLTLLGEDVVRLLPEG